MNPLLVLLSLLAAALGAFGCWGLFSVPGRKHYDEMAAFYPAMALLLSGLLLLVVLINVLIKYYKNKKRK